MAKRPIKGVSASIAIDGEKISSQSKDRSLDENHVFIEFDLDGIETKKIMPAHLHTMTITTSEFIDLYVLVDDKPIKVGKIETSLLAMLCKDYSGKETDNAP